VAVTRNGLVASLPELADENPDSADEEHWSALFELLPSDGVRKLTTRRLGKAIGDIRGTTVFWVEPDPHGIKLVAYDTEHHRYLRTLSVDDDTFRLYAVDKAKAYLMGDDSVRLWDAMAADNRLAEVPNLPRDAFIADAHDCTLFVSAGDNGSRLISASSRVLKTFDSTMIATFSPDGKSIAAIEYLPGFSDESTVFTWNLERSVEVPLDLRAGIMVDDFQWEADGDLLVLSQPAEDSDDASQEVHSCSVETGACTPFSGRWQHTTSGYDQFAYDAY
jgi:WD40 repeat protein